MKEMTIGQKITMGFSVLLGILVILGVSAFIVMKTSEWAAETMAQEAAPAVDVAVRVEVDSFKTMLAGRNYHFTGSEEYAKQVADGLTRVLANLKEADTLAGTHEMKDLAKASTEARAGVEKYSGLQEKAVALDKKLEEGRAKMDVNARAFVTNIDEFLEDQDRMLREEVTTKAETEKLIERVEKNRVLNEMRGLGNACRLAAWRSQAMRDPEIMRDVMPNFEAMGKIVAKLDPIVRAPANRKQLAAIDDAGKNYRAAMSEFLENWLALQKVAEDRAKAGNEVVTVADAVAKQGVKQVMEMSDAAESRLAMASMILAGGIIVALVVAITIALKITKGINFALNRTIAALTAGAEQTASAAGQVSSASQSLAEGASEQAASLEETSSSLEEMGSMTRQNASNSQRAKALANEARTAADGGQAEMTEMANAMRDIQTSSQEISKIIKTIDEIAFQTNILALNAAVEAARAGEAGMGFAVVADEVRNLAQRAALAARETEDKISAAISKSQHGVQVSERIAQSLNQIIDKAKQVDELIAEVATASQEQDRGIEQINLAVSQMDKVTQTNAASAEESASASEELNAQALTLRETVAELQRMVGGAGSAQALPGGQSEPRQIRHAAHIGHPAIAAAPKREPLPMHQKVSGQVLLPGSDKRDVKSPEGGFHDMK